MNVIFLVIGALIVVAMTVYGGATFFDRLSKLQNDARKWRELQKKETE